MRAVFLLLLLLLAEGLAQVPNVPQELLKPRRRLQDNKVFLCVNTAGTLQDLDRAIGQAIAKEMLAEAVFVEVDYSGFPVFDDGDFFYSLYIDLTNNCDGFLGLNMAVSTYPDWLNFSRPYATIPFVMLSKNPDWKSLGDVPKGKAVGTLVSSSADAQLINYQQALSEDQRWQRIPYGSPQQMVQRLNDGTLSALLIWSPLLANLGPNLQTQGLYLGSTDPLPPVATVLGVALRVQDAALRNVLDQAIGSLINNGAIQNILQAQQILGTAGGNQPTSSNPSSPLVWPWLIPAAAVLGLAFALWRRRRSPRKPSP